MKKIFFCVSLVLTGLMTSCVEKNEEVDASTKPSWLGESIYAELENPGTSGLTGTFSTYLRLIQDLGEAETLNRTGSKTVFPANDEAFKRFFANNDWGVTKYSDLSTGQKKMLLYSSMLDNPLLLQLLPNVSNGTVEPDMGGALKHSTNVSVTDSVTHWTPADLPANNHYWDDFATTGIDIVSDATRPMMIHLTREYMLNNGITTLGDESDFAILTGSPYPEGSQTAYIFNNKVIVADVTCQNGYIHQMQDVVVPPGNMASLLRRKDNTKYFSRVLDYFAVPIAVPKVTNDYNSWARKQSPALPDKEIYALRYLSNRSYDSEKSTVTDLTRINGNNISSSRVLSFDPGWNGYYPNVANASGRDVAIMDMGAFFVPSDDAMRKYFLNGGSGSYLIDIYGNYKYAENTEEHFNENLDSLHSKNPQVLTAFVNNLLKASFANSVPSKFETVLNDASEVMGLNVDSIHRNSDGKFDITFANNGAVYVMNTLFAPDEYQAVLAPSSVYPDMKVMNWAVQDRGSSQPWNLGVDFKYYLLSMSSNYAFFVPDDSAFHAYYLDPATMGHREDNQVSGRLLPDVLHFSYNDTLKTNPKLQCERYYFNLETGKVEGEARSEEIKNVKSQLIDILNYHTVVLPSTKVDGKNVAIGYNGNHFYKTKHGGTIYVDGHQMGGRVMSGAQIDHSDILATPKITQIYEEKNGNTYRLDHVIQPPVESVYAVLNGNSVFSEFLSLCNSFDKDVMKWAGISDEENKTTHQTEQDAYVIFTQDYKMGTTTINEACLDYNVKFFNTYHYTLFAPDNTAMEKAYNEMGLPRWESIEELYDIYKEYTEEEHEAHEAQENIDKDRAKEMIKALRDFIRYHFVVNSVYADNQIEGGRYKTMASDDMGVAKEVRLSGGSGRISIKDMMSGHTVTVDAGDKSRLSNKMTRDYWFDKKKTQASSITTSSFCAVHQISEPLCGDESGQFYYSRRAAKARRR